MTLSNMYQAQIQQNYNLAIGYYKQRREMITELYLQKTQQSINNLVKYIDERATYYFNNVTQEVFNYINLVGGIKNIKGKTLSDLNFPVEVTKILQAVAAGHGNPASLLGNEFEQFLYESLSLQDYGEVANSVANAQVDTIIDSLLNSFGATHTGNIKARSAVVSGKRNIRPDIGLGFSEENKQGSRVELEGWLDLSDYINATYEEMTSKHNEALKDFLQSSAMGLSLKVWKNPNNQEFSQSKPLMDMINRQLYTVHPQYGYRTTWEGQYAMDYINYQISKYLINIISPLNIAMVTGNGFMWMDEFLSNKIFFMTIQLNSIKKSIRGPGWEGFPEIASPNIYIRAAAKGVNIFNYSVRVSSKTGRISMTKRKIKVY